MGALDDPGAFHFREHADECKHGSADRRGEVQGLSERDESNTEMLQLVEERHEVAEVTAEPIESSDGDEIELPPLGVGHQRIETGPLFAAAAHGEIGEFSDDRPTGAVGMFAKSTKLILGGLIAG